MAEKTTTQTTQTETKPTPPAVDPWNAMILEDLGKIVKDGAVQDAPAKAAEDAAKAQPQSFTTLADVARANAEKAGTKEPTAEEKAAAAKEEEKKAAEAKAAEEAKKKKEAEAKPGTETPNPATATKPKVEVEKRKPIEEVIEGVVNRLMPKPTEQKTAEKPAQEKKEDKPAEDPFVAGLADTQKEAYELAQFAAKKNPDKYGKLPEQLIAYYKKAEAEIDRRRTADKDWNPEEDEDFSAWIEENQPAYQEGDKRRLERDMIATQAKDEARKELETEFRPKIEETERLARAQSLKPEIEKSVQLYKESAINVLAPDDKSPFHAVVKTVTEGKMTPEAWSKAEEVDPLAASIAKTNIDTAGALAEEYMGMIAKTQPQVPYRSDLPADHEQNVHAAKQYAIFTFLDRQEQIFMADPNPALKVKNGRTFVSRRDYSAMPEAERAKHWTIGNDDVLDMLAIEYVGRAKSAYETEMKRLEKMGYTRQVKHLETKKEDKPTEKLASEAKPNVSPKTTTSTSPGTANGSPITTNALFTPEELKKQWEGGAAVMKV